MNKPYEIIADTRKMSHADWLQMRKIGLGGSDCAAAALIGSEGSSLSRWKSPFTLWAEKTDSLPVQIKKRDTAVCCIPLF